MQLINIYATCNRAVLERSQKESIQRLLCAKLAAACWSMWLDDVSMSGCLFQKVGDKPNDSALATLLKGSRSE